MSFDQISLFSGNANPKLAKDIARYLGIHVAQARVTKFHDGETKVQIVTNVRGMDVFIIQPTCPPVDDNLMELLIMIDAIKRASAKRIVAVIPYYGYGRQDKKHSSRAPITAKLVADLITKAGVHSVLTLDLHAGQIQGFFSCPVDALKSDPVIVQFLREYFDEETQRDDLVIVSPDVAEVKRALRIAERLNAKVGMINERGEGEFYFIGEITTHAVVVKDMLDTGVSMIQATKTLIGAGAKNVIVACTHALLSNDCIKLIMESPISKVIITDSTSQSQNVELVKECNKIIILSIASLIGEAIRRIHNEESVSSLFQYK
ncbi:ribose-phosphate pyrophosphokinase-like [Schistocerca gregaria]|uniref:ribose-phosphate pyrophosphokinase-like n=1 Tax=Schistocerca gregaria TaxID=7010 RepID=UPI00211E6155|nr:ribose-phosphate pyrophosphokinase-like [Schistocerca gregaria]